MVAIRCVNAMHWQAVREGPHSNSVGFLLHNTMACVTTVAGTIKKPFRCVRLSELRHKHASMRDLFQCKCPSACIKANAGRFGALTNTSHEQINRHKHVKAAAHSSASVSGRRAKSG